MQRRPVPFVDVPAMMRVHGENVEKAIADVVRSGMFINGPKVHELEQRLAEYVGVRHAIACGSGTDAQQLALMALEIGPGDEVLVPDFTFIATAEAVANVGATPVMVDVDPLTFTMDPVAARAAMTPRVGTRAAMSPPRWISITRMRRIMPPKAIASSPYRGVSPRI